MSGYCCVGWMLLTALVQPHWVTTDVWHELEPESLPCVSARLSLTLALVSADLPSIRAAGAGASGRRLAPREPGRVEARGRYNPAPASGQRLPQAGLWWKMSSQLDRGDTQITLPAILEIWNNDSQGPALCKMSRKEDCCLFSQSSWSDSLSYSCVLQH